MKRSELVSLVRHLVNVVVSFYSRFKIIPLFIWAVSFNFMFVFRFLVSGVWLLVFDLAPWNFPSADALPYAVPMLLTSYVLMNAVFCRKPALYHNATCVAGSKNLCGKWIYAWDLVVLKTIPLSSFRQTANITCTFFHFGLFHTRASSAFETFRLHFTLCTVYTAACDCGSRVTAGYRSFNDHGPFTSALFTSENNCVFGAVWPVCVEVYFVSESLRHRRW